MNYYSMIVSYDGTDYCGWQLQPDRPTITGVLQNTFQSVFETPAIIVGASRTDSGVHALGQVCVCRTELDIEPDRIMSALNNRLPADIVIRAMSRVDETYHPQRRVEQKIYWYHFFLERPLPLAQRYGWYYRYPVDLQKLRKCLDLFLGTHNFRSFCTGNERGEDTIRTIDEISLEYLPCFGVYRIEIKGKSFLRYMIRRIVGACLEVASRPELACADIERVLAAKNPAHSLPKAPAKGLVLYNIIYQEGRGK